MYYQMVSLSYVHAMESTREDLISALNILRRDFQAWHFYEGCPLAEDIDYEHAEEESHRMGLKR